MKKILSIAAVIAGALYLSAGIALLIFQDIVKEFMGYGMDAIHVYPVPNVLKLAIVGVPCVVLGVLSMSEAPENRRGIDILLVIYSSMALVLGEVLFTIGGNINTIIVGRTQGAEGLANVSMVSASFSYIQFLIDLSLVLLLLRGALSLGESEHAGQIAQ
ncbi:MAG: hypothetical protein K2H45_06570 [Acetatifactor sp.]|nr:hypothetical protein [Acetatifactor sp.]